MTAVNRTLTKSQIWLSYKSIVHPSNLGKFVSFWVIVQVRFQKYEKADISHIPCKAVVCGSVDLGNVVKGTSSVCLPNTFCLEKFASTRRDGVTFSMHFVINPNYDKMISFSWVNNVGDQNILRQATEWGLAWSGLLTFRISFKKTSDKISFKFINNQVPQTFFILQWKFNFVFTCIPISEEYASTP